MAGALGQLIGDPIQISEGYGGSNFWYYSSWNGWGYGRNQCNEPKCYAEHRKWNG